MKRFFAILFFLPLLCSAQQSVVDSLKLVLKKAVHDSARCTILNAMVEAESDIEVWPQYNHQLKEIAEKNIAGGNPALKNIFLNHLSNALNNEGYLYDTKGEVNKALSTYHESLKIAENLHNKKLTATLFNNIAYIYDSQGDIPKALDFFHRSLRIQEEIKNQIGIAQSLNNIGFVYSYQGELKKALEYYDRSLKIKESLHDAKGIALSYNNIGFIHWRLNNHKKGLEYYFKSLKISSDLHDQEGLERCYNNLGNYYFSEGENDTSLIYYQKALREAISIQEKEAIASNKTSISIILFAKGELEQALPYAKEGLKEARELGYPDLIEASAEALFKIYHQQGRHKDALEMYELHIKMSDSLNNLETKKSSLKREMQYMYEKKAAADSVRYKENEKIEAANKKEVEAGLKQEHTQRLALYWGIALLTVFFVVAFNRFRIARKQKKIIEQQKLMTDEAFHKLHEKNKEILDSIHYARRIQQALLTNEKYIERVLKELNK